MPVPFLPKFLSYLNVIRRHLRVRTRTPPRARQPRGTPHPVPPHSDPRFFLSLCVLAHQGMSSHRTADRTRPDIPGNTTIDAPSFHTPDLMMSLSNLATSTNSDADTPTSTDEERVGKPHSTMRVRCPCMVSIQGGASFFPGHGLADADGAGIVGSICCSHASGRTGYVAYLDCDVSMTMSVRPRDPRGGDGSILVLHVSRVYFPRCLLSRHSSKCTWRDNLKRVERL